MCHARWPECNRFGQTHTQPQLQDSLMALLDGPPACCLCAPAHAQSSRLHSCAIARFISSSPREPPQNLEDYWASLTAWQCWAGSEAPGPGSAGLTTVPTRYSLYIARMVKVLHAHCTRRCDVNSHDRYSQVSIRGRKREDIFLAPKILAATAPRGEAGPRPSHDIVHCDMG